MGGSKNEGGADEEGEGSGVVRLHLRPRRSEPGHRRNRAIIIIYEIFNNLKFIALIIIVAL